MLISFYLYILKKKIDSNIFLLNLENLRITDRRLKSKISPKLIISTSFLFPSFLGKSLIMKPFDMKTSDNLLN